MSVKIKLDAWAKKKLKNRMGMKMLGGGELSVPELLILSLIEKEDGDTMDLTKEAGKLEKVLNKHS